MWWNSSYSVASDTETHLDLAPIITCGYPREMAVYINLKGCNTKLPTFRSPAACCRNFWKHLGQSTDKEENPCHL